MHASAAETATSPQQQSASGRKNAIRLVALASAVRLAKDIRTHRAVIMVAIGLVAAAHLAREGRNPLEWYFAREPDKPE